MAIDYGFASEDAAQMGGVLMAKITVKTTESPGDYSGVPVTTETVEEIPLLPPMQGPAPMMMPMPPPDIGAMPNPGMAPGMAPGAQMMPPQPGAPMPGMPGMPGMPPTPGAGSMGAQAAQQVMQQFGTA